MWFDPTAIAQRSPPLATSATSATSAKKTGDDAPKVAGVAEVATPLCRGNETTSYCWLVHFSDRNPLAVDFSPAATHDEVLDAYPDALAAEPIEPGRRQPDALLAGDQETAVVAWLAQIGETDQEIVAEVLRQCRQDEGAREYFLGRAGADPQIEDDRRCCSQCRNLRSGVCIVAEPHGVVSAIRGYRPAPGILQRCLAYMPAARSNLGADPGLW